MTFRAFSIGFSAALLALACGSDDNNPGGNDDDEEVLAPIPIPPPDLNCATNQLIVGCDPGDTPAAPPPGENPDGPGGDVRALAETAAQNILNTECGQCHGPALDAEDAEAGMNFINDMDQLVASPKGLVIPLNSKDSLIIKRMVNGEMPPSYANLDPVSQNDIDTVASFIDNPLFWDIEDQECGDQLFTFDQLYRAMAVDIQQFDADEADTIRYISLTNRFTAGVCAENSTALDRDRQAMVKLLNMLSTETSVEAPTPINDERTIYRIDLEDYGWDAATVDALGGAGVDVVDADGNIQNFPDKWEAIVANNVYAVPFEGDDADRVVDETLTAVPVMFADSMLDVASIGNLYYSLIDVDVTQTLDTFVSDVLEINVAQNILDGDQVRAGTTRSKISRQDRVLERNEIEDRQGALWTSFDFLADGADNQSIFQDPFNFAEGGSESIFTLPNGMLGFVIADEANAIVEDSDILTDSSQDNFRAVTSVSCTSCHAAGFIPVADEVRDIALSNARDFGFDDEIQDQIKDIYLPADEFAAQINSDSRNFYQRALTDLGLPIQGVEPVSFVFLRFDEDVTLADAAGDLGLSAEELEDELGGDLDPILQVLDGSRLDRDDFTDLYVNSLCILQVVGDNAPVQQVCDDAQAELDALNNQ
jgi:mono/diheme cytochrome c family protein